MWVTTGFEHMLSWIERENQPTVLSEHTSVWDRDVEDAWANRKKTVLHSDMSPVYLGWLDEKAAIFSEKGWEGNLAASEHAKKKSTRK